MNWMPTLIASLAMLAALPAAAEPPPTAPVRLLGNDPQPSREAMAQPAPVERPRILPTEYEMPMRADTPEAAHGNGPLRLLLVLPRRVLLIETVVTVDGRPFGTLREQRIERLLTALTAPPEEEAGGDAAGDAAADDAEQADDAVPPDPETEDEAAEDQAVEDEAAESAQEESGADNAGEDNAGADNAGADEEEPSVPLREVPNMGLEARLRRYAAVTGRPPSRDELRWLVSSWIDGPTLLLLDRNFQRYRATQAPALDVLDRDFDGVLSGDEWKQAMEALVACDRNQNDVIEFAEITSAAGARHHDRRARRAVLLPILDAETLARSVRGLPGGAGSDARWQRYDTNENGTLDLSEVDVLRRVEPDVVVTVSFQTQDPARSTIALTHLAEHLNVPAEEIERMGGSLLLALDGLRIEFSAVQAAVARPDQFSVGVVDDGYPLLPVLDANEDGRLSVRELRGASERLRSFDADGDGAITSAEISPTIRVAIGWGATVHLHLATVRSVYEPGPGTSITAPDWFTRMDTNKDNDVSPREFLLGPEQFRRLDTNQDGLISAGEAAALKPAREQDAERASAPVSESKRDTELP